jgi:hypothetical protein
VSLNSAHGKAYSIQHLSAGLWFSLGTPVSSTTKTEITEIVLKVAWNTITQPNNNKRCGIIDKGVLGITDIYSIIIKSIKFMWIKKMMDNSFDSSWKDLTKLWDTVLNRDFIFNFRYSLNLEEIKNDVIKKFGKEFVKFVFKIKFTDVIDLYKIKYGFSF